MSLPRLALCVSGLLLLAAATAAEQNKTIPGIGPAGEIEKVHGGFAFTEGPAHDAEGNIYFTDIPSNRILKVNTEGKLSTFLENSKGCNGLMFYDENRLIACQGNEGRIVVITVKTKEIDALADKYNGKRFNRPNDLVVDRRGGVYFTDPLFGQGEASQDKMAVYYVSSEGKVSRLIDDLPRPNGVILSPDEKTLYVLPSGSPNVMAYQVEGPGKIGPGKVLCKLEQKPESKMPRGGDGLTVDTKGNLYLTQPDLQAIQVVSPEGKTLGLIKFPERPSNCTFGGRDMKTLFVTANSPKTSTLPQSGSLYAVRMEATGHRFGAGR